MTYGLKESGRVPNSAHESGSWRIHEVVPGFRLEDVWALPVEGAAEDFPRLLEIVGSLDPAHSDSAATRFLWQLRDRLGAWFDLGRVSVEEGGEFGSLPFSPLYRTDREAAAEISNKTVHGIVHFAWVERGEGRYQGQMAVYVKPRGAFGRAYMALIKPFRYLIVYPALMRQFEQAWSSDHVPLGPA